MESSDSESEGLTRQQTLARVLQIKTDATLVPQQADVKSVVGASGPAPGSAKDKKDKPIISLAEIGNLMGRIEAGTIITGAHLPGSVDKPIDVKETSKFLTTMIGRVNTMHAGWTWEYTRACLELVDQKRADMDVQGRTYLTVRMIEYIRKRDEEVRKFIAPYEKAQKRLREDE